MPATRPQGELRRISSDFIREKLEDGVIRLDYCPTEHMEADVLTKGLSRNRHQRLVSAFGLGRFGSTQSGSIGVG